MYLYTYLSAFLSGSPPLPLPPMAEMATFWPECGKVLVRNAFRNKSKNKRNNEKKIPSCWFEAQVYICCKTLETFIGAFTDIDAIGVVAKVFKTILARQKSMPLRELEGVANFSESVK